MSADGLRFGLPRPRPAVVTVDLHRGHLDPSVATIPLTAEASQAVVAANRAFLARARRREVPVVHVITSYRADDEILANPFWRAIAGSHPTRGRQAGHNLEGGPGVELMPGLMDARDRVVRAKKRYDPFLATDLEFALKAIGADLLFITGVNTNSCVLATAVVASTRDYACVVVSDCVDSMDGRAYHDAGLRLIGRAFGWVMTSDEAVKAIEDLGTAEGAGR
jgi:biuret amidohydrolase